MRPEDVRDNTTKLNQLLREKGLLWVVEEVSRVIEDGVEEKKAVSFESFTLEGNVIPRRGPKSEVTATRPYTDEEQLELLLDAVKAVLVDGAQIRAEIFAKLVAEIPDAVVRFEPDIPSEIQERGFVPLREGQGKPFVLTQEAAVHADAVPLRRLIDTTKEDLNAGKQ